MVYFSFVSMVSFVVGGFRAEGCLMRVWTAFSSGRSPANLRIRSVCGLLDLGVVLDWSNDSKVCMAAAMPVAAKATRLRTWKPYGLGGVGRNCH